MATDPNECTCGAVVEPFTQAEIDHFVWAVRMGGTRSNLGYCPWGDEPYDEHGKPSDEAFSAAVWKARRALNTFTAEYHGHVV